MIKDVVTAILQSDFLKFLKSIALNLKPGMAWQKAFSLLEFSNVMRPLLPTSMAKNFTLNPFLTRSITK